RSPSEPVVWLQQLHRGTRRGLGLGDIGQAVVGGGEQALRSGTRQAVAVSLGLAENLQLKAQSLLDVAAAAERIGSHQARTAGAPGEARGLGEGLKPKRAFLQAYGREVQ